MQYFYIKHVQVNLTEARLKYKWEIGPPTGYQYVRLWTMACGYFTPVPR